MNGSINQHVQSPAVGWAGLGLLSSRYAAILACGAAGRNAASFQTTSLASLILLLPNSDLSVSEYTIVKTLTLSSVDAELKNAKGQHAKGHTEGLFPFKRRRCVIGLRREAALCFSNRNNNSTFPINGAELRFSRRSFQRGLPQLQPQCSSFP